MAAVGAMEQLATKGELDYGELAINLVINTFVDVGMDAVTGSIPGGTIEGPGQTGGSAFGEMSPEDILRYNQYWNDVKAGKYDIPYGMTKDEYYQFKKGLNQVDQAIRRGGGTRERPSGSPKTNFDDEIPRSADEWLDYFNTKYGQGSTTQNFKVTLEMEDHMKKRQIINPKTNKPYPNQAGIVGAHNSDKFFKNDVRIFDREKIYDIYGNEVSWTEKNYYNMPVLVTTGKPISGSYSTSSKQKTIYYPGLISDQEYCRRAAQAANNALAKETSGALPHVWEGVDSQGVKWVGNFEKGKITSFFPTN